MAEGGSNMAGEYDLKPNFPIASVADLIANRGVKENAMKQQQYQNLIQGIGLFGQGVQSLVEKRNQMAQAAAQADILMKRPEFVQAIAPDQRPVATVAAANGPVTLGQTATPDANGNPIPNAMPSNLDALRQKLAVALQGNKPDTFLKIVEPQTVQETVYQKDAQGNIVGTQTRTVPKGSKSTVVGPQPTGGGSGLKDDRIRQMAAAKVKEKVTTDINEIARGKQQIEALFSKYNTLVEKGYAGGPVKGGISQLVSKVTGGGAGTEDVKAFMDLRDGLVASLKKITGDTGVMTEQDATRIIGLLSSLTEDPKAAKSKLAEIQTIFETSRKRAEAKGNTLIQEIQSGNDITPINSQSIFDLSKTDNSQEQPKTQTTSSQRNVFIEGAKKKGYSQVEAEHLADEYGFKS